jgi:O-antigen/teichoic acid export membrane protein
MSTKKIAQNTIAQIIGKAFSMALAVFTIALMARYLGAEQFGWYTTTVTYLQMFGIFIDFGLTLVTTQMMAELGAREEKIVKNILGLRLISAVVFFGAAAALVWFFPYPFLVKLATTFTTFSFFFIALNQVFVGVLQRHMAMWWATIAENINRVVMLVGIWLVIAWDFGFLWVMGMIVIGGGAQCLALFGFGSRFLKIGLGFEWKIWKKIISRAWPIAISIIFNLVYLRGDLFIMSLTRTQEEVGLYGAAFRVVDVLNTIPFMLMGVMLPLLTRAWSSGNKKLFNKYLQNAFDILIFLSMPIALGGFVLSERIMILLGGVGFTSSAGFLQIILLAVIGVYGGAAFSHAIIAINKQRKTIWIYGVNALIAVIAYIIFIPIWGGWAAAIITAMNEILVPLMVMFILWRLIKFSLNFKAFWKILFISLVMAFMIWPMKDGPLWMPIVAAIVIYSVGTLAMKIINPGMIKEFTKTSHPE